MAGGIYQTSYQNIHLERPKFTRHEHKTVEFFDFYTRKWDNFGAQLAIPRYNAAMVFLNSFIYVFGGQQLNGKFLNTIERSHSFP